MSIALFLLGLGLGFGLAWFLGKGQTRLRVTEAITQLEAKAKVEESKALSFADQVRRYETELEDIRKALSNEREAKAVALTRLEETAKNIEEQKKILDSAQEKFEITLEALSSRAIKDSSQEFLGQAKNIVSPLEETLKRYEEQIRTLEQNRASAYGSLENQIQSLIQTNQVLQKETGNLASAFKNPNVRGQWGQFSLRRIVELAGMTDHCDFQEQVSVNLEEGSLRPDMVVHLPGGTQVVIDSKVVLQAYRDEYLTAADEASRKTALKRHAQQLRAHMADLSSKNYWGQFPKAPEFVVMFVPGEPFISAACEQDESLIEDGIKNRVILAAPTTLIALLRAVAMGWRQEQVTKNTQQILDISKEFYERFAVFLANLTETRDSLEKTVKHFNKSMGSLDTRVLVSMRKLKDYGVSSADLEAVEPIEQTPRPVKVLESRDSSDDLFAGKK